MITDEQLAEWEAFYSENGGCDGNDAWEVAHTAAGEDGDVCTLIAEVRRLRAATDPGTHRDRNSTEFGEPHGDRVEATLMGGGGVMLNARPHPSQAMGGETAAWLTRSEARLLGAWLLTASDEEDPNAR